MAEAALKEVRVHLSYLRISSPVDGVVTRQSIEPGNMANPGMPLLWVETEGDMKVVAHLGEKDIPAVTVGTLVEVDVTSLENARFTAPLTEIEQTANPGSRTYDIEAALDTADPRLKSGMFARVTVPVGTREAILVPAAAVQRRGQLTGVWTVAGDGTAHLRWVRLGRPQGEDWEVLAGLDGTEAVVLGSEQPLVEGDRVVN
jgi:RND family efflux transporter MFP subunit